MNVKTYRAKTMQDALALVRRDLGPQAAVLHTREVRAGGLWRFLNSTREIEVMASANVSVPSRLPAHDRTVDTLVAAGAAIDSRAARAGSRAACDDPSTSIGRAICTTNWRNCTRRSKSCVAARISRPGPT